MQAKLYVGNLSYQATQEEIRGQFSKYGTVQAVNLITDRSTGQSKGFGFVEMSSAEEAQKSFRTKRDRTSRPKNRCFRSETSRAALRLRWK